MEIYGKIDFLSCWSFGSFFDILGIPEVREVYKKLPGARTIHSDQVRAHSDPPRPHSPPKLYILHDFSNTTILDFNDFQGF